MISWVDRYWEKVEVRGPDECWEWTGGRFGSGYGELTVDGKGLSTHRLAWELANGPIPQGMLVCHHCDNPTCCNPAHLFIGTAADNNCDKVKKGRSARGAKHGRAKLTQTDVRQIRKLWAAGEYTQRELGDRFGVRRRHINRIVNKKTWVWLDRQRSAQ